MGIAANPTQIAPTATPEMGVLVMRFIFSITFTIILKMIRAKRGLFCRVECLVVSSWLLRFDLGIVIDH